jgi:hypothetical protein
MFCLDPRHKKFIDRWSRNSVAAYAATIGAHRYGDTLHVSFSSHSLRRFVVYCATYEALMLSLIQIHLHSIPLRAQYQL